MKTTFAAALLLSLCTLTACARSNPETHTEKTAMTLTPARTLVVYYSWSGNTRAVAQRVAKSTGAAVFEIKPATPYPTDYGACVDQAKRECRAGHKPALAANGPDLADYDVIFVGTPNWWGTMAPPVLTFLTSKAFAGKTVVPFLTHGGGGRQRVVSDIEAVCKGATFLKAGVFSGSSAASAGDLIDAWLGSVVTLPRTGGAR
ncbi:MAG: flavodoxin [Kiritimatiellia bacterium]